MATFFSKLYVELLSKAELEPGEVITAQTRSDHAPWYTKFLPWLKRERLLLATNRRLIIFTHGAGFIRPSGLLSAQSLPWSQVGEAAAKGLFGSSLALKTPTGKQVFQLSASYVEQPTKGFAKVTAETWAKGRALPA